MFALPVPQTDFDWLKTGFVVKLTTFSQHETRQISGISLATVASTEVVSDN